MPVQRLLVKRDTSTTGDMGLGWLEGLPLGGSMWGTWGRDGPMLSQAAPRRRVASVHQALSLNLIRTREQRVLMGGDF